MGISEIEYRKPSVNSRVAFIGLTSSIPFGSTGTVLEERIWNNEYLVILDEESDYAHNYILEDKRIFIVAYGGDLYVIP